MAAEERKTCRYCARPGPRCEYHYCGKAAEWSAMVPTWRKAHPLLAPKFFCASCWELFKAAWEKPMKGIDRPSDASEDWSPSLMEHLRWSRIDLEHNERLARERAAKDQHGNVMVRDWEIKMFGWTPGQVEQVKIQRSLLRKYGLHR